jgi:hypothetical protein
MKHINRIAKLSEIDYSPLAQNVDTDFAHAWANDLHWFPIAWFESALDRTEFETRGTSSFIGEIRRSSRLDPTKFSGFIVNIILYKYLYIWQV